MLNIFYGDMPQAIYNPVIFFKNTYTDEWIVDNLSRAMIQDVDRSTVLGPRVIDAIYKMPELVFNASACGDNCAKWLLKIGSLQNVTINLRHLMDFGNEPFKIKILNANQIVHNMTELLPIAGMIVR